MAEKLSRRASMVGPLRREYRSYPDHTVRELLAEGEENLTTAGSLLDEIEQEVPVRVAEKVSQLRAQQKDAERKLLVAQQLLDAVMADATANIGRAKIKAGS